MTTEEMSAKYNAEMPQNIREYLNNRGITNEAIEKYQLGYGLVYGSNWITIPIKDSNREIKFFKLRRDPFNDLANPSKYMTYKHGDAVEGESASGIFNEEILNTNPETIVITEGEFDCIILNSKGIPSISFTTGAGSNALSQIDKLTNINKIIICFDADTAGKNGAIKMANQLYENTINTEVMLSTLPEMGNGYKDITDYFVYYNGDELAIINNAKRYFPSELITAKDFCINLALSPQPKWLIDDFVPHQGCLLVAGPAKSGKTYFLHYIAKSLSEGIPLFDTYTVNQKCRVLIIDKENSDVDRESNLKAVGSTESEDIIWCNKSDLLIDNQESIDYLKTVIAREKIGVVILDPFIDTHNAKEDNSGDMSKVFRFIRELMRENVSVIIAHHMNKSGNGTNNIRGSSAITAAANIFLSMELVEISEDESRVIIKRLGVRSAKKHLTITARYNPNNHGKCFELLSKEALIETENMAKGQKIIDALADLESIDQIGTIENLLPKTGMSRDTFDKYTKDLVKKGLILLGKGKNEAGKSVNTYELIPQIHSSDPAEYPKVLERTEARPIN